MSASMAELMRIENLERQNKSLVDALHEINKRLVRAEAELARRRPGRPRKAELRVVR